MEKLYEIEDVFDQGNFWALSDEFNTLYNHICFYKRELFNENKACELQYPVRGALYKPSESGDRRRSQLGDNLQLLRLSEILKIKAQKILGKKLLLYRVQTNIQFFGMESAFHKDGGSKEWTFLVCANDNLDLSWGGPFVIHTNDTARDYKNVPILPNKGILFRADLEHFGSAPNRLCAEPRLTLAASFSETM